MALHSQCLVRARVREMLSPKPGPPSFGCIAVTGQVKERNGLKMCHFGDRKSLSIAKNHPKPSQEFSEQFGPSIHKMKGFSRHIDPKSSPKLRPKLGKMNSSEYLFCP